MSSRYGKKIKIELVMSEFMALNLGVFLHSAALDATAHRMTSKRMRTRISKMATEILRQAGAMKNQKIKYNPDLDVYSDQILFPKKVAEAKEIIRKYGTPKFTKKKK